MEWNWETLLWIGGFVLLFWFMMRACGGMMGGGCGMGGRRDVGENAGESKPADATEPHDQQRKRE